MARSRVTFREWEPDQYPQRIEKILASYSGIIGNQFQKEIRSKQFTWPNPTRRTSGAVVTSPRDIVDTGAFAGSQLPGQSPRYNQLVFQWTAAYALAIFLGYYKNTFQKEKERDWVTPALEKQPLLKYFALWWAGKT
jgi:hypothetical protein